MILAFENLFNDSGIPKSFQRFWHSKIISMIPAFQNLFNDSCIPESPNKRSRIESDADVENQPSSVADIHQEAHVAKQGTRLISKLYDFMEFFGAMFFLFSFSISNQHSAACWESYARYGIYQCALCLMTKQ